MVTSNSVDYDTSAGSKTRHDLDRLTSLGTMLSCIVYGAHVAVYLVAMKYIVRTSSIRTRQNRLWLGLSTILLMCTTASLALQVRWSWDVERMLKGSDSAFNIARVTLFMIINWVSDSIFLLRFFAITGRRLTTMILPLAMITSSIAISSVYIGEIAAAYTNSWSDTSNTPIITYLSLSCGLNVYLTAHIALYMVQLTRKISMSRALCNRIASMFVQSTLFYLIPTLVFIALCAQRDLGQNLLFPTLCQIQPLSPLLVVMRVAQSRLLDREGAVVTADEILSASASRRPRLSLQLDFRPRDSLDIEGGESWCESPMEPTTTKLPDPLPFVRLKLDPPSAVEMLDSEKMDGLWKSQDSRRASWLTSPSPSTPSYLPTYASSQDDLKIDEFRLHDPSEASSVVTTPNSYNFPPAPSIRDTSFPSRNLSNPLV
ncbi:hypothetical protein BDM02DRAFT_3183406 [Thelephora ganbajun]|uniref:Uncharacterized protein n=1 Tax=Thelephora ganbajun TaxID=370292 RepID=A0ACB6ZTG8_THEGA|nr:hypothetical protein BDM02DRAFT_3183406 [Thelephora ganbajun]